MTKISTRRPDGTLFGQNSAPVGFSVDRSEPLVCVFRGASRPCACFARNEDVEIFSQCRINTFLFFFSRLSEGASSDSRSLNGEFLRKAVVNCSSVNLWFFQSFRIVLKLLWKRFENCQTSFKHVFQWFLNRMFKDIFKTNSKRGTKTTSKTCQRNFQKSSKRFELFSSKVQNSRLAKLAQSCCIISPNESNSTNTYKHALTYLSSY